MEEEIFNLEIKWPWTMLPLAVADEYIEYLQKMIGPGHPLYKRDVFPACRREDTREMVVQFDLDDARTHAIVFFDRKQRFGNKNMPRVEMIDSISDLQKYFERDYNEAMENMVPD